MFYFKASNLPGMMERRMVLCPNIAFAASMSGAKSCTVTCCHIAVPSGSKLDVSVSVWPQDELFASLYCQPNFPCSRNELSLDLKTLLG